MEVLDAPPAAQAALVVAVNTKRQKTERHALTDPNLTPSMNKLFKVPSQHTSLAIWVSAWREA